MKKFTRLALAVVAFGLVGCTNDTTEDLSQVVPGAGGGISEVTSLEVTIPSPSPEERTALGEKDSETGKYPISWSDGDYVGINGVAVVAEINVEEPAKASFTVAKADAYHVVYPYSEAVAVAEEGEAVAPTLYPVEFAGTQPHTGGTFAANSFPMYGYAEAEMPLTLNYLSGVLRIAAWAESEVSLTSIVLTAEEGALSGKFQINCQTGELTPVAEATSNTITYTFAEPYTLSTSQAEPSCFYVAVPAGNYGVFTIRLNTTGTEAMVVKFASNLAPVQAGKVREFSTVQFKDNAKDFDGDAFLIYTEADLERFAMLASRQVFDFPKAKLMADIELTKPIYVAHFDQVFDGAKSETENYTISGLTAPLFGTVTGTIQNLNVEGTIVSSTADDGHAAILVRTADDNANIINCHSAGSVELNNTGDAASATGYAAIAGLIAAADNAHIENCSNSATVTLTSVGGWIDDNVYGGGICGYMDSGSYAERGIIGCENNGAIAYNATRDSGTTYIGGIIGRSKVKIIGCENKSEGAININNKIYNLYVGGIAGYFEGECNIETSNNLAAITVAKDVEIVRLILMGGIVGQAVEQSNDYKIYDCDNSGKLTMEGNILSIATSEEATEAMYYLGGICGYSYCAVQDCQNLADGEIYANGTSTKNPGTHPVSVGGISGRARQNVDNCDNFANITSNVSITETTTPLYVAGVVGYLGNNLAKAGATISGCDNQGNVNVTGKVDGAGVRIGGIVGNVHNTQGSQIKNCTNGVLNDATKGSITYSGSKSTFADVAGIVASYGSTTYSAEVVSSSPMTGCTNYGAITNAAKESTSDSYVGGIAGQVYEAEINRCTILSSSQSSVIIGDEYVGGICGYTHGDISNCHVASNISGSTDFTGGIVGSHSPYSYDEAEIINCSYTGVLNGGQRVGGIAGSIESASTIKYCKVDADIIVSGDYVGGICGYTDWTDIIGCYSTGTLNSDLSNLEYLCGITPLRNLANVQLCYSTMTSNHKNYYGLSKDASLTDCATAVATGWDNYYDNKINCQTSCTNITEFLETAYSEYAECYDFNNTWTWTGKINGSTVNVSCPKLAWEK